MKKFIIIMALLIIAYRLIFISTHQSLGNGYVYVDDGHSYWSYIVNNSGTVIPVKVIEFHSDSKYIIAVRTIIDLYECYEKNTTAHIPENNVALPFISRNKLQYWLIDKKQNIAYFSESKKKIERKIKEVKSQLKFKNEDYTRYLEGTPSRLPDEYICVLINDPFKNNTLSQVVDLDKL